MVEGAQGEGSTSDVLEEPSWQQVLPIQEVGCTSWVREAVLLSAEETWGLLQGFRATGSSGFTAHLWRLLLGTWHSRETEAEGKLDPEEASGPSWCCHGQNTTNSLIQKGRILSQGRRRKQVQHQGAACYLSHG